MRPHCQKWIIASVWLFHGIYSKLFDGIPRHQMIVGRVLGARRAKWATRTIGLLEALLGTWVLTGRRRKECALVQTVAIGGMNGLEIALAKNLLLSVPGMLLLNVGFLVLVWRWACPAIKASPPAARRTWQKGSPAMPRPN